MSAPVIVLTGPPGVGKTTVASLIAASFSQSAVVEGDCFHRFLRNGRIQPWLPESHAQNTTITSVTVEAAAGYARDGWTTVLEGILGPWFLPMIRDGTNGLTLHYFVMKAPLDTCVSRFTQREPGASSDVVAKMHREFAQAPIEARHVVDSAQDPEAIAAIITGRIQRAEGVVEA